MMDVIIAIDDLHPEKGWGCDGDESVTYLESLNSNLGCKFNLFVPSNYHKKYPLSEHREWVDFWYEKDWVELCAHGHYHQCETQGIGEQEFRELDYQNAVDRIEMSMNEWGYNDVTPKGFRMPGWGCNQESAKAIGENYTYTAAHQNINQNIHFGNKVFYGEDGIHNHENISLWDNRLMFQSHIAGDWNDNCWNEQNYGIFSTTLESLAHEYPLNYTTLGEISEDS